MWDAFPFKLTDPGSGSGLFGIINCGRFSCLSHGFAPLLQVQDVLVRSGRFSQVLAAHASLQQSQAHFPVIHCVIGEVFIELTGAQQKSALERCVCHIEIVIAGTTIKKVTNCAISVKVTDLMPPKTEYITRIVVLNITAILGSILLK